MRIVTRLSAFAGVLLAVVFPAGAQQPAPTVAAPALPLTAPVEGQPSITEVLSGKLFPLKQQLKEMDAGWCTFHAGAKDTLSPLMIMGMMHGGPSPFANLFDGMFTKGQTVVLGGETFLIAYACSNEPLLKMMMDQEHHGNADPMESLKLTPETEVTLSLLSIRTMGNISDIKPFSLKDLASTNTIVESARANAQQSTSLSQLRQIATATLMYIQDNNGNMPPADTFAHFQQAVGVYLGNNEAIFHQPNTNAFYQVNTALNGHKEAHFTDPVNVVVVFEATPWPDGKRGVGFLDGHAKMVTDAQWQQLKARVKTE